MRSLPGRIVQGVSGTAEAAAGHAGGHEWPAKGSTEKIYQQMRLNNLVNLKFASATAQLHSPRGQFAAHTSMALPLMGTLHWCFGRDGRFIRKLQEALLNKDIVQVCQHIPLF